MMNVNTKIEKVSLPRSIKIITIVVLIVVALHFHFYFALKETFHGEKSVNPKATAYFLHATSIHTVWITSLHQIIGLSYNNPVLKPFLLLRDYFFQQGEKYVHDDNSENVIWWLQNYGNFYGFYTTEKDKNFAIKNLPIEEQKIMREVLYRYIVKLGNNEIRGVESDKYGNVLFILASLIQNYLNSISLMYDGQNNEEKLKQYYSDRLQTERIRTMLSYFDSALHNDILDKDKKIIYQNIKYYLLQDIIFGALYQSSDRSLPQIMCTSQYVHEYIQIFHEILQWINDSSIIKDQDTKYFIESFKMNSLSSSPGQVSTHILQNIQQKCSSYYDVTDLLKLKQGENNGG
ncbi:MAG: hypothetical protein RBR12_03625 [Sulfurospirillum cavolei]|nr:hypothetical protein [Sulfurospirillum cavolei]